ncbi:MULTISPECIES: isochorismatase family protein [Niallia]|jgi:nicotinamidase-related amidase|uniref:Amidase n=1 Tax=Niallia circulans TaxID=1397 RepID=A0A268FII4_NIACI|nr:isochorismatase family protein [Niallia circulans]AYV66235.1 amidase [Niallia circulans]AYV70946.1 amidase [Niallia circulans]NRG30087.1 isochorismatase family protein [Niallia circulans]PAD85181.1 amidase [Niallia circulans]QJX62119.1 isochorismatase family protein [Niallia circulans]
MKQALIIIDMQEIFFNHPKNYLYDRIQLVKNINILIKQAHEKNIQVIFIQHTDPNEQSALYEGKNDWKLHQNLLLSTTDKIIKKSKWDAFYKTELLEYLKSKAIEQLIFAGAQTEFCLDTTIRAAYSLGFQQNLLYQNTHSTINGSILNADNIIDHHESIWNNRFLTIKKGELKL